MTSLNTPMISEVGMKAMPKKQNFNNDEERLKAAKEYSKMFFGNMLKQMFKSTEESGLWGDSHSSQMLRPVWIDAIADTSAGKTGFEKFMYKALGGKNYEEVVGKSGGNLNVRT